MKYRVIVQLLLRIFVFGMNQRVLFLGIVLDNTQFFIFVSEEAAHHAVHVEGTCCFIIAI